MRLSRSWSLLILVFFPPFYLGQICYLREIPLGVIYVDSFFFFGRNLHGFLIFKEIGQILGKCMMHGYYTVTLSIVMLQSVSHVSFKKCSGKTR